MKKKLEADLMSIAHRVLQMKNKSDINQLCIETRKLYEKLAILQFVEEHFEGPKSTIGQADVVEKMKQFFEENHLTDLKPSSSKLEAIAENTVNEVVIEEETSEEVPVEQDINEIENEKTTPPTAVESNGIEEIQEEVEILENEPAKLDNLEFEPVIATGAENEVEMLSPKKEDPIQISFEDFLGKDYSDTLFVKLDQESETAVPLIDFELPKVHKLEQDNEVELTSEDIETKTVSLNDKFSQGINVGLNDRIGFVKNLFGNSDGDYNRVLNQLITYDNFEEAQNFIAEMIKPDYNKWAGKEDYEQRFMEIIEKKFS